MQSMLQAGCRSLTGTVGTEPGGAGALVPVQHGVGRAGKEREEAEWQKNKSALHDDEKRCESQGRCCLQFILLRENI